MPQNEILFLEELSLNAWPSLQTVYDDGWVLRFADGYTGRANSVNPLYHSSDDLEAKIDRCEAHYNARGQETIFKLTPASPTELDDTLDRRGYKHNKPTSTQSLSLADLDSPVSESVTLSDDLSEDWLAAFCALRDTEERHLPIMRHMIQSIVPSRCFATLYHDGVPAALGFGVLERGYVGLYDIVTDARLRNRGLGRQLVLHLLNWAKAGGATYAYLQVMLDNAPAVHLYQTLGFREVYPYWYRSKAAKTQRQSHVHSVQ